MRLHKDDQAKIAHLLKDDRDITWILRRFRGDTVTTGDSATHQKENLINRFDIHNIESRFGLRMAQKHPDDLLSVDAWVKQEVLRCQQSGKQPPLFCYSEPDDSGNFSLGIQTEFQCEMLKKFGQDAICIDSTHGTTQWKFLLVTVLIIDQFGKGFPVAWCFMKKEDTAELKKFFNALKDRVGELKPKVFMSDDYPAYFNAWSSIFDTKDTQKLLCIWHVYRNWNTKLKEKGVETSNSKQISDTLRVLVREVDEKTFHKLLNTFLLGLAVEQPAFEDYFRNSYCSRSKIVQWAAWARRMSTVNTNMYLESFHHALKYKYLQRKHNNRLDFVIHILFVVARDYLQSHAVDIHSVSAPSYRLTKMHSRHRNSWDLHKDDVKVIEEYLSWEFKSKTLQDTMYTVNKQNDSCACKLLCRYCNVCPHIYLCTCDDTTVNSFACKHIHFIHGKLNCEKVDQAAQPIQQFEVEPVVDPTEFLSNEALGNTVKLSAESLRKAYEISRRFLMTERLRPIADDGIAAQVLEKFKEIDHLYQLDKQRASGSSVTIAPISTKQLPRNKLLEPQKRCVMKPKTSKRPSVILPKTSSTDKAACKKQTLEVGKELDRIGFLI